MNRDARILLVDDCADARGAGIAVLERGGFRDVVGASGVEDAYDLLGIEDRTAPAAFDCILLDIVMPGIDGVEACAAIRASRRYRNVPIIMVSGQDEPETLNLAFVAGANDYVAKPFRQIDLLARLRSALGFQRQIDRRRARERESRIRPIAPSESGSFIPQLLIADRSLLDAEIRLAATMGATTTMCVLHVRALGPYRMEHGAAATDRLLQRLSRAICDVAAPVGTVFGLFDDGVFLAVAPNVDPMALVTFGDEALRRIAALAIPHGASAQEDHVALDGMVDVASGGDLLRLPGTMMMLMERQQRSRGGPSLHSMESPA